MITEIVRLPPVAMTKDDAEIFYRVAKKLNEIHILYPTAFVTRCQRADDLDAFLMWSYTDASESWTTKTHA